MPAAAVLLLSLLLEDFDSEDDELEDEEPEESELLELPFFAESEELEEAGLLLDEELRLSLR